MATITLSDAAVNAVLTEIANRLDAGTGPATISVYTGTKPAGPDTAITTQVLLGTQTCSDPVGFVASRSLTFGTITQDSAADDSGNATWARTSDSDAVAVVDVDVTATGGGGFLQLNTTAIVAGGPIQITSFVITA